MFPVKVNTLKLKDPLFPEALRNIPQPPKILYFAGESISSWIDLPKVAVVGSRKISPYGTLVTNKIVAELASRGVVIISGLAFGVDAAAHRAALESGGPTIAVLPTSLANIYPPAHHNLARSIVDNGGTLISEYNTDVFAFKQNFVARNRIVSGLADLLLITEAAVNSGSLHTARFALEQGKTVMVVPGNITSPTSEGCNNLIKSGAVPVTSSDDIFFALKLSTKPVGRPRKYTGNIELQKLLRLIEGGVTSQEELALSRKINAATLNSQLTALEISGVIKPLGGGRWILS